MEAAGVALAVLPIFDLCLKYLEYFKTAQSLVSDCELLVMKLDFEHERLIIWGTKHGLADAINGARAFEEENSSIVVLVKAALKRLEDLFTNTQNLQDKYGIRQTTSTTTDKTNTIEIKARFISTAALKRIKRFRTERTPSNGINGSGPDSSVLSKATWAIHDKAKFEVLVKDIRDIVTGLYDVLPVPTKEQNRMVAEDLQSLLPDLRSLKQLEIASEELYPAWSEAASMIVAISEVATTAPTSTAMNTRVEDFVKTSTSEIRTPGSYQRQG